MPQWAHKYWESKFNFDETLPLSSKICIISQNLSNMLPFHAKIFYTQKIFVVSKKHEIIAIFTYLVQRIQRSLLNVFISLFLHSLVTPRNTTWVSAKMPGTHNTTVTGMFLANTVHKYLFKVPETDSSYLRYKGSRT